MLYFLFSVSSSFAEINCKGARLSLVEKEICANPKLMALDADILTEFERAKTRLSGDSLELLTETQKFFLQTRNICDRNQDRSKNANILLCIEKVSKDRSLGLKNAEPNNDLFDSLTLNIRYTDVPFILKYGKRLVGKTMRVWGILILNPEKDVSGNRLTGFIASEHLKEKVPVEFKSMTPPQAEFLDKNQPASHHEAKIEFKGGKTTLRLSSILGKELP